jgi:hypothetical protein
MKSLLTAGQRALIEHVASLNGLIELYEDDSINGLSWTLRYKRRWAEPGASYPRSESHMIFAVRKPVDEKDDSKVYAERMKPKVAEAKALFLYAIARRKT